MASPTLWEQLFAPIPEGIHHRAARIAALAPNPEILGLQRCTLLEEAQRPWASRLATVNEIVPRKVIQVSAPTCHQETCRDRFRWSATNPIAIRVHEPRPIRSPSVRLEFEKSTSDLTHPLANWAPEPTRKG